MSSDSPLRSQPPLALPARYRVKRHIATGGMASVWCAEDLVLDRNVAVKVLAERFAHDHLAVLRFKREARAAARVSNHPHVVTVYDVGELEPDEAADATHAAGRAFIVMEFLAGGTVADAIRHDVVGRHEALRWLREAASALDHAHAHGIVHRDIKPANFLLDRTRTLHVADFGIAHLASEETITSSDQLFGTAAYLSPEQALGREATGASDRYALAVAAFELLAGERPFSAEHFSAQARQHIEEPPPSACELDRSLPPAVDDVLFAGLAKDPQARPHTARAFVSALEDALRRPATGPRPAVTRTPRTRTPDPAAPSASTAAARRHETARTSTTRPESHRTAATGARGRGRFVAFGALCLAALLVGGIAFAALHRPSHHGAPVADHTVTVVRHRHPPVRTRTHTRTAPHRTTTTTAPPTAADLESAGHTDILNGDYANAIPILKQAIAAAPHDSPTYAYALYDLGHAEVLSGDPQAAIPVLRQRMQVGSQHAVVKVLLEQALAQAGQGGQSTVGSGPGSGGASPTTPTSNTGNGAGQGTNTGSGGAGLPGGGTPTTPSTPQTQAPPSGPGATTPRTTTPSPNRMARGHRRHRRGGDQGLPLLTAAIG